MGVRRAAELSVGVPTLGRESFAEFYRRECPRQVRRATLILGSPEAAHDAVHDAFVAVFGHWDELTTAVPYLERAVLNRCRDLGRRGLVARRRTPRPAAEIPEADTPLFDALATLPFSQRAAVVLRYYHQLTEVEIAELLHCRPGSVGPWIQRGLRRLRKELT